LVTPANRRDIALGKILGIGVFALMSAIVSIMGATLAMPTLMGLESGNVFDFYSAADFVLLLLVAMSTTLIFVSLLSVLSALAKSVKEANAYAMPLMFAVVIAGLSGMIMGDVPEQLYFFLIPVVNSSLSIAAIFSFNANATYVLVTAVTNFSTAFILTVVLAKVFGSERIVFDR
jgi:sodium transport system permease protein